MMMELKSEMLEEVNYFKHWRVTIAVNGEVESIVRSNGNKSCTLLVGMKNVFKISAKKIECKENYVRGLVSQQWRMEWRQHKERKQKFLKWNIRGV